MVVKKKVAAKKPANFEKKVDDFASNVKKEAKFVSKEGKVIATWIWSWWHTSSNEMKIYTVIGALLIVWGLYILFNNWRWIFISVLLIILGILFVTGYFTKKK